jgi:hypothetical protein
VNDNDSHSHALIRIGDLNRAGAPDTRNTLTPTLLEISSIDLTHSRALGGGRIELGLGFQRLKDPLTGEESDDTRGFLTCGAIDGHKSRIWALSCPIYMKRTFYVPEEQE